MHVATPPFIVPYNWLRKATVYNKNNEIVPSEWIREHADVLLLLFTAKGVDKDGVIEKFYNIYENVKQTNVPIDVIYIPMDDNEEDMKDSYEEQANWFTLLFHDPLVHELRFMYGITCIPHIVVIRVDGSMVSSHGIIDLEQYGKNAIITWLSTTASSKIQKKFKKSMYGKTWKYLDTGKPKMDYLSKIPTAPNEPDSSNNIDE